MKSQELSEIMTKKEELRTAKEKCMLELFEMIKTKNIDETKKLKALLNLCIPEEKDIYIRRYNTNNHLLENNKELKMLLEEYIGTKTFNLREIKKFR